MTLPSVLSLIHKYILRATQPFLQLSCSRNMQSSLTQPCAIHSIDNLTVCERKVLLQAYLLKHRKWIKCIMTVYLKEGYQKMSASEQTQRGVLRQSQADWKCKQAKVTRLEYRPHLINNIKTQDLAVCSYYNQKVVFGLPWETCRCFPKWKKDKNRQTMIFSYSHGQWEQQICNCKSIRIRCVRQRSMEQEK